MMLLKLRVRIHPSFCRRQRTHGTHVADVAADAMEPDFCVDSSGDNRQGTPARVLCRHSTERQYGRQYALHLFYAALPEACRLRDAGE